MLSFPRNLNLLIDDDLSIFFQEVTRSSYQLPVTTEDKLKKLIQFGEEFFPNPVFEITAGMTPLEEKLIDLIRAGQADKLINDILPIIFFLYNFKDDNSFINKVKANLLNPSQFNDTFFELKCYGSSPTLSHPSLLMRFSDWAAQLERGKLNVMKLGGFHKR